MTAPVYWFQKSSVPMSCKIRFGKPCSRFSKSSECNISDNIYKYFDLLIVEENIYISRKSINQTKRKE